MHSVTISWLVGSSVARVLFDEQVEEFQKNVLSRMSARLMPDFTRYLMLPMIDYM